MGDRSGSGDRYNCFAYAMGTREGVVGEDDLWLQGNCDDTDGNTYDFGWVQRIVAAYGWRPSAHCFSECDKRKVVMFGSLRSAEDEVDPWNFFDVKHVAVEAGDQGWLESKFGPAPRLLHRLFDISGGCFNYGGPMGCWEMDVPGANPTLCDAGYDPFEDPFNEVPAEICDRWGSENYLFCRDEFCAQAPGGCPPDDADLDDIPFALDSCPTIVNVGTDTDEDGVDDACDNCIDVANPFQENCDLDSDDLELSDRRGDACDPDPCSRWHERGGQPLRASVEDAGGGNAAIGRVAYFSFDGLGGEMSAAELPQSFQDNYADDQTTQDVRPAHCSCAQSANCAVDCPEGVLPNGNALTGTGWFTMTREVDGDAAPEVIPDVPFVRGGPGGGGGGWRWQTADCPGPLGNRVDCNTLGNQRFRLWLRPMVDPASWPTGWPNAIHNFYADGEHQLDDFNLPNPPPETEWPGPRFFAEGACFHCDMEFFGEGMLPFIGEFAPGTPLPPLSPYRFAGYTTGDPTQGLAVGLIDPSTLSVRRYVPTKGLTTAHEPRVTGAVVAVQQPAGSGFDATLWLYGGIDRNGAYSSALYRGDVVPGSSAALDRVVWTKLTPAASPPGRVGALFSYDPVHHALVLYGGTGTSNGELGDLWRYDISSSTWSHEGYRAEPGAFPGYRGFPAVAQAGQFAYVYGGRNADDVLLDDLYEVDLAGGTFTRIDQSCSGAGGGSMLMAGGAADSFMPEIAALEDDEPFELDEIESGGAYEQAALEESAVPEFEGGVENDDGLGYVEADAFSEGGGVAELSSGGGPGARAAADLALEPGRRALLLYGGITSSGTRNDLWRFDLSTRCWEHLASPCTAGACPPAGAQGLAPGVSSRTAIVVPTIGTELHPSVAWHFDAGRAARSPGWLPEYEWARQPAAADCNENGPPDTGAGFACATSTAWHDPPGAKGCTLTGTVACPQIAATLDASYSVSATSPVRIAARGNTLVVASGTSLKRYRIVPESTPVLTGTATLNGTAVGIVLDGPRAFVATSTSRVQSFSLSGGGLTYQNQRTFTSAVGAVGGDGNRLYVVSGNKLWVLDSSSAALPTIGSVTLPQSSATALAVVGRRVVIANGTVVVVVSVTTPSAPVVQGSVTVGTGTTALRGTGQRVYAIKSGSNYVIDVSNPAAPVNVGTHDAIEWAKGAVYLGRLSVRINGTTVQVAAISH